MSAAEKGRYWQALKASGVNFERHYREYTLAELRESYEALDAKGAAQPLADAEPEEAPATPWEDIPVSTANVHQYAAQNAYTANSESEPVRVDPETGFIWFREEVLKPATPMPRARRKLTYVDSGTKQIQIRNGEYMETVEVAGQEHRTAEVRITMPSYQVGVYKDPRLPFKIHTYGGVRGFDLFEVQEFYGGSDLVPSNIKPQYVANDLCYDITTTVRALQDEYSALQKGLV